MQPGYKLWLPFLMVFLILPLGGSAAYAQMMIDPPMHPNDPTHSRMHPLNSACSSCHVSGRDTRPSTAAMLINSQEKLCDRCHANSIQKSHPSGFIPPDKKSIPLRYPLDWRGYLTCSTCHEVHSDMPGRLRGNVRGKDMCLSCHSQGFFDGRRNDAAHRVSP